MTRVLYSSIKSPLTLSCPSGYNIIDEKSLFKGLARDDAAAFYQLFHHYNSRLYPFVKKITRSGVVAEDIVQETFLRLWKHRKKVADMEQPAAWLFLIASNLSMSHLRNHVNQSIKHNGAFRSTSQQVGPEPIAELEKEEFARLVENAIRRLPPKRQQIFRMSRQDGLAHKEIASQLGLSPHTVKDHLVMALKSIKDYLRQFLDSGLLIVILLLLRDP